MASVGSMSMTSSVGSISPMTSPMESDESRTWLEPQQQLTAYMAWVNSQLKKKPGTHLIEDLRNDMRDGVVFADVIEIVSKQRIPGIHDVPATYEEMRHNIDLVLQFMTQHRIKMHRISSRDIVEGNLKAVMRLILALAAHYKPMSVRHSASSSASRTNKTQSVMDIAQGASAALTEARRNAKKAGKRNPRSRHDSRYHESSSEPCSDSDQSYLRPDWRIPGAREERRELEGCSANSSPVSSCRASPRTSLHFPDDSLSFEHAGKDSDMASVDSGVPGGLDDSQVDAIKAMKKQLLQLQDVILGNSPDSAVDMSFESSTPEGVVLMRSQLQHVNMVSEGLREELLRIRNDCLQLQGTKAGLQQRLGEQDSMLSQLKSDKLNLEIELQTVTAENVSLRKELNDQVDAIKSELGKEIETRDQTITGLRRELMRRDQMIDKLQQEIKRQGHIHQDFKRLHSHIQAVGESEKSLTAKVAQQDRRIMQLGDRIRQSESPNGNATQMWNPQQMAAEVSFLQDSLHGMQAMLSAPNAQPPPLDKLERSIITMLQNLRASRHPGHHDASRCSLLNESVDGRKHLDKSGVPKLRSHAVQLSRKGNGSVHCAAARPSGGGQAGDGPSTSVIFFTDHSIQPTTCLIAGKLGEIRLKDFKNLFEDCERYRYYFKALDPEYGTVKEELTKGDAIVPGWEDKIVAWVETESGTPC